MFKKRYVIVKDQYNLFFAYRKILGMWGILTYVSGSCSDTMEGCVRNLMPHKPVVVKEITL